MTIHALGDLDAAGNALERALTIEPDNASYLDEWGSICFDKGNREEALLAFQTAVKIEPESVCVWSRLGIFRLKQAKDLEALSAFQEALRIDPNHVPTWEHLCSVHRNLRDRPRMQQALSRLQDLAPAKARGGRREILDIYGGR